MKSDFCWIELTPCYSLIDGALANLLYSTLKIILQSLTVRYAKIRSNWWGRRVPEKQTIFPEKFRLSPSQKQPEERHRQENSFCTLCSFYTEENCAPEFGLYGYWQTNSEEVRFYVFTVRSVKTFYYHLERSRYLLTYHRRRNLQS